MIQVQSWFKKWATLHVDKLELTRVIVKNLISRRHDKPQQHLLVKDIFFCLFYGYCVCVETSAETLSILIC